MLILRTGTRAVPARKRLIFNILFRLCFSDFVGSQKRVGISGIPTRFILYLTQLSSGMNASWIADTALSASLTSIRTEILISLVAII